MHIQAHIQYYWWDAFTTHRPASVSASPCLPSRTVVGSPPLSSSHPWAASTTFPSLHCSRQWLNTRGRQEDEGTLEVEGGFSFPAVPLVLESDSIPRLSVGLGAGADDARASVRSLRAWLFFLWPMESTAKWFRA